MSLVSASTDLAYLVKLRDLVIRDPAALSKVCQIVDHLVSTPADALRIKTRCQGGHAEYEEGILNILQIWYSLGHEPDLQPDLLTVFRDLGLTHLAEKVGASGLLTSLSQVPLTGATGIWFEIDEVVYNFTGRESELQALHTLLSKPVNHECVTINIVQTRGLGGVGKSSLARKYAHTYKECYDGNCIWINAETANSMRDSFLRLASRLGLRDFEEKLNTDLSQQVYSYFRNKKVLFIFDNVEVKTEFVQFQPRITSDDNAQPRLLLTSRRGDLTPLAENQLNLGVLTFPEAIAFIRGPSQLPGATETATTELANKLERLPLALQQAVAYIREKYLDDEKAITKYLMQFETSVGVLLKDKRFTENLIEYSMPTYATWDITLEQIKRMDCGRSAIKAIKVLAFLNPDSISVNFVCEVFCSKPRVETEAGLKLLERFSMIQLTKAGVCQVIIHRLVQHVVRLRLSSRKREKIVKVIARAIGTRLEKDGERAAHELHLLKFQMKKCSRWSTRFISYFYVACFFLPMVLAHVIGNQWYWAYVIEILAYSLLICVNWKIYVFRLKKRWRAVQRSIDAGTCPDPIATLLSFHQAVVSQFGYKHELTLEVVATITHIYSREGNKTVVLQVYADALAIKDLKLPQTHPLAWICQLQNAGSKRSFDEAISKLELTHSQLINLHGENDCRAVIARNELASTYFTAGDYGKALENWESVATVYEASFGAAHVHTLKILDHIQDAKAKLGTLV